MAVGTTASFVPFFVVFTGDTFICCKKTVNITSFVVYHHLPYGAPNAKQETSVGTAATIIHFASFSLSIIPENAMVLMQGRAQSVAMVVARWLLLPAGVKKMVRFENASFFAGTPISTFWYLSALSAQLTAHSSQLTKQPTAVSFTLEPGDLRAK